MKYKAVFFFLTLFSVFTIYGQTIPVYKIEENIIIDGDLSEWKSPFSTPFVIHNSGEKATQNTFVLLSWNDENLYLAYRAADSQIIGMSRKKDAKIFETDDLVEVFIDPDGNGENYLEIGVNAFSAYYDLIVQCISPKCGGWKTSIAFDIEGLEAHSKITPEGFCTEIKIPFSSLEKIKNGNFKTPKAGTKWKGNMFRIDYGNTTEYQALEPYKSGKFGFHHPEEFGVFEFIEE